MSKAEKEFEFPKELDSFINGNGLNNEDNSRDKELLSLMRLLSDRDFSKAGNKEAVFSKVQSNINKNKGENIMKKLNKTRRFTVAAALVLVCILSITFMQTTYANNMLLKIKKTISLGRITVAQIEPVKDIDSKDPDAQKKIVTDKDGKTIAVQSKGAADNKSVKIEGDSHTKVITETKKKNAETEEALIIKNPEEIKNYTSFNAALPSYLPENYKFDKAELYKDEKGNVSPKYINMYFSNNAAGKTIFMQQRAAEDETSYFASTDGEIDKVQVNGKDAVITDDSCIAWDDNNVMYLISAEGIEKSELIKIAESVGEK